MKRYALFRGQTYYPGGGWEDFVNTFDTLEEAKKGSETYVDKDDAWHHVVDLTTGVMVFDSLNEDD